MPTISISRAAAEEGTSLSFVVTLSEPVASGASVQYRVLSGTALDQNDVGFEVGTVVFEPGATSATITVQSGSDGLSEFDESVFVELFDPVGAELSGNVPVLQGIGWILDDEGAELDRGLQVSSPTIVEGPSGTRQMVFEVSLSEAPTSAITMNYRTTNGTAVAGTDYTAASGQVTFAAGQTTAFVSVNILGNTISELSESFNLVVTPTLAIGNGAAGAVGVGTIRDANLSGNNTIIGTSANNQIFGGAGNDSLSGVGGNDQIFGGTGRDSLIGGAGDDILTGDRGIDTLTGGVGADDFRFNGIGESSSLPSEADRITDFQRGVDDIDLRTIDASIFSSGNNAFVFRGFGTISTSVSGEISVSRVDNAGTATDFTLIRLDNDRDAAAEAVIRLTGLINLTASDFLL